MKHVAIVLAAGASARLGRPKQTLVLQGETLIHRAVRLALATNPLRTLVVLGANAAQCAQAIDDLEVDVIHCRDWRRGMGRSLAFAIEAVMPGDAHAALVLAVDQPGLDSIHLGRLLQGWYTAPEQACASVYAGRRGVPAIFPRQQWAELSALDGDQGARAQLRTAAPVTEVACEALAFDIDTPDDLQR